MTTVDLRVALRVHAAFISSFARPTALPLAPYMIPTPHRSISAYAVLQIKIGDIP